MSRPPVEHREVLIIGAGPAGTAAAAKFSELGHDVLVLDRRAVVGNPAQCGECIPNWGEVVGTFRDLDDHDWLASYFEWPDRIISQRLDHMRVVLPSGKTFGFELDCISSPRLQFDGLLAERAVAAGAEVRMEVALTKVLRQRNLDRELYITTAGRFTADLVIDATGALAHVARLRRGKNRAQRPDDQVPTAYAQVRGDIPQTFDVFLGSVAPSGYAWIIPKGSTANVGLGARAGRLKGNVKEHLARFCDGLGLEIMSYGGGWIPMGGPIKRMVDDNVLAVGDAAGLVMPSNGGGISQAIISGVFAAETGSAHLKEGTPLGRYEDRVRSSMGPALRNSLRSKRMAYLMMHGDLLTDVLLRILGPIGGIRRAMECGRPLYVL